MSRLYCWIDSDSRKTILTSRAYEELELKVNYGSRSDSKKLVRIWVRWEKGTEKPTIWIESDNQRAEVHTVGVD